MVEKGSIKEGKLERVCAQHCAQEGSFVGPENGPKQRKINKQLLSYRPVNNLQTLDFAGVCSDVDSRSVFGEQQIHEFHEL